MITADQWPLIKEIVGHALECGPDERQAFLDAKCAGDGVLRAEVDSLIAAYDEADGLSLPGWAGAFASTGDAPRSIGPYRLLRELGVGGMGQVWLAEQTEPVRRQVAIKLIRAGLYDKRVLQRFLSERQSLALMNHPAIAKIFDAGATPDGQPYLVMEYVDGLPITDYCDRHTLTIAERLKLFQLVCEGVQHAHQKAVIHRDLKPSNILVTEIDGRPMPQIIDFGVAKGLIRDVDPPTLFTQMGTVVGTLGYMSPEQWQLDAGDVDTRTDVYSLGVVLYELLVGALPFDPATLRSYASLRRSMDMEAPKPSTRLRMPADSSAQVAHHRGTDLGPLRHQLRGDLDSVVLKALENDRQRRYATPAELSADIGNYLRNEPVSAHAPSVAYRSRKYLRRHWAATTVAAGCFALLIVFAVAQTIQLRNTRLERDRADQITDFMTKIFKVVDPSEARGNTVTAREILDKSSQQIETGVGLDAGVQSDLLQVMASTYTNLGLYARAHSLAQTALDNRRRLLGPQNPKTLESLQQIGDILFLEGHSAEAEDSLRRTLELQVRVLGLDDVHALDTQNTLVSILVSKGRFSEAEKLGRETVAAETRTLGPRNVLTLVTSRLLAGALMRQSRFDEAERLFRQTVSVQREVLGPDHPDTLKSEFSLGGMLREQGKYPEAVVVYRDVLAARRRVLGDEHPVTADTMATLAMGLAMDPSNDPSRHAEAEDLFRKALAIEMPKVGPESRFTTRAEEGLANLLDAEHRYAEAESLQREVLRVRLKVLGPDNTDTLLTQTNLADVLYNEGRVEEAEHLYRSTLEHQIRVLDPNDVDLANTKSNLADVLLREHRAGDAEPLAREAFEELLRLVGPQHRFSVFSLFTYARALAMLGRYDEATALYSTTIDKITHLPNGNAATVWYDFARLAALSGRVDDAFDRLEHAAALGYKNVDSMRDNVELKALRKDARFTKLMETMQSSSDTSSGKL
jgi:serine/threonine protein kinase/tetratricopeptide (TPR) repeat protein